MKVAQALARDAEKKKAEAVRLAIEFDTAKNAAREAGQVSPSGPTTQVSHISAPLRIRSFASYA